MRRRDTTTWMVPVALALAGGLAAAGCGANDSTSLGAAEDCFNGVDDDGDGDLDCADDDCWGHVACDPFAEYQCDNGLDDDEDGAADCADDDCKGQQVCNPNREVLCRNDEDDDGDGLTDCLDPDCVERPACQEQCDDGRDNDLDGYIDCRDDDCEADPACRPDAELDCGDGLDNDGDGLTDCADTDCAAAEVCDPTRPIERCDDGVDNDGDSLADCADPDCAQNGHCREFDCSDGIDNEGDGKVDCRDPDCHGPNLCQPDPTCAGAMPVSCGDVVYDYTWGLVNTWSSYTPCLTSPPMLGGERVFKLYTTGSQTGTITVEVIGHDPGVNVALVALAGTSTACDTSHGCQTAYDSSYETGELVLTPSAGADHYLVVDSEQAAGTDFTLSVFCYTGVPEDCTNDFDDDGDGLEDCWDPDCQSENVCDWWVSGGIACDPNNPDVCAPGETCTAVTVSGMIRNDGICTRPCAQTNPAQCDNLDYENGVCVALGGNPQRCLQECGFNLPNWSPGDCPTGTQCTDLVNGVLDPLLGYCAPIF